MEYPEEEANPLLTSSGPRRRQPQAAPVQPQTVYSSSTSEEDFSKKDDRRSLFHRCCTTCSGCACARPELDAKQIYYEDNYNDDPWDCTFGTSNRDGIWVNFGDRVGTVMASMVWILILYSVLTISLLAHAQKLSNGVAMLYGTISTLALACHAKTTFTDPGSIPQEAVPREELFRKGITTHAMCSHCQTYKPPLSHHCRICNRCISRMDHHCPWMNNCIGANNFSEYIQRFKKSIKTMRFFSHTFLFVCLFVAALSSSRAFHSIPLLYMDRVRFRTDHFLFELFLL